MPQPLVRLDSLPDRRAVPERPAAHRGRGGSVCRKAVLGRERDGHIGVAKGSVPIARRRVILRRELVCVGEVERVLQGLGVSEASLNPLRPRRWQPLVKQREGEHGPVKHRQVERQTRKPGFPGRVRPLEVDAGVGELGKVEERAAEGRVADHREERERHALGRREQLARDVPCAPEIAPHNVEGIGSSVRHDLRLRHIQAGGQLARPSVHRFRVDRGIATRGEHRAAEIEEEPELGLRALGRVGETGQSLERRL